MSQKFVTATIANAALFVLAASTALAVEETGEAAAEGLGVGMLLIGVAAIGIIAFVMANRTNGDENPS
jgi:hypothetical protein